MNTIQAGHIGLVSRRGVASAEEVSPTPVPPLTILLVLWMEAKGKDVSETL